MRLECDWPGWGAAAERAERLAGERAGESAAERAGETHWRAAGERLECGWPGWRAGQLQRGAERLESTEQLQEQLESRWIRGWDFVLAGDAGERAGELQESCRKAAA